MHNEFAYASVGIDLLRFILLCFSLDSSIFVVAAVEVYLMGACGLNNG